MHTYSLSPSTVLPNSPCVVNFSCCLAYDIKKNLKRNAVRDGICYIAFFLSNLLFFFDHLFHNQWNTLQLGAWIQLWDACSFFFGKWASDLKIRSEILFGSGAWSCILSLLLIQGKGRTGLLPDTELIASVGDLLYLSCLRLSGVFHREPKGALLDQQQLWV